MYFVSIIIVTIIVVSYMNYRIGNPLFVGESITNDTFVKIVDVKKESIFNAMANIGNYPKVLPENYVSVNIINRTDSTIYSEEEVAEIGIKTKMLVKHTIIPYEKHVLEVLDGDANGTKITEIFEGNDSTTKLTTTVNLHLHGVLSTFGLLPKSNLEHAMDTILDKFVEYTKLNSSQGQ